MERLIATPPQRPHRHTSGGRQAEGGRSLLHLLKVAGPEGRLEAQRSLHDRQPLHDVRIRTPVSRSASRRGGLRGSRDVLDPLAGQLRIMYRSDGVPATYGEQGRLASPMRSCRRHYAGAPPERASAIHFKTSAHDGQSTGAQDEVADAGPRPRSTSATHFKTTTHDGNPQERGTK